MATQKALVVREVGKPVELTTERRIPQPSANEIQIRVTVAALNPHDEKGRGWGLMVQDDLPAVLANDVAGVVTALGSDVHKFKIGDRVFAYADPFPPGTPQKGLQEYAVTTADYTAKIPEGFTDHDVTTLPVNLVASTVGLFDDTALNIPPPWSAEAKTFEYAATTVLILGGGSNCGRYAVQLAKIAGIGTIVVLGGDEQELKTFGATHVLDRHGGDDAVQKRIRDVVGDDLVYSFDCVNGPDTQYVGINPLSNTKKGTFARLVPISAPDTAKVTGKQAGYEVKSVHGIPHMRTVGKPLFENLTTWLTEEKIVPLKYEVVKGLDADKANEVLDRYRDGKKVVQTHFRISE